MDSRMDRETEEQHCLFGNVLGRVFDCGSLGEKGVRSGRLAG